MGKNFDEQLKSLKGKSIDYLVEICNKLIDNSPAFKTVEERELMKKVTENLSESEIIDQIKIYLNESYKIAKIISQTKKATE